VSKAAVPLKLGQKLQCHHSCVKICSATEVVLILRFQLVASS
jgi:hypothetical protein